MTGVSWNHPETIYVVLFDGRNPAEWEPFDNDFESIRKILKIESLFQTQPPFGREYKTHIITRANHKIEVDDVGPVFAAVFDCQQFDEEKASEHVREFSLLLLKILRCENPILPHFGIKIFIIDGDSDPSIQKFSDLLRNTILSTLSANSNWSLDDILMKSPIECIRSEEHLLSRISNITQHYANCENHIHHRMA